MERSIVKRFLFVVATWCVAMLLLRTEAVLAGEVKAASFRFEWASITLDSQLIPKAAILVPIRIPGTRKRLYAQLDTGSDGTFFYGKILNQHGVTLNSDSNHTIVFEWGLDSLEHSFLTATANVDWDRNEPVDTLSKDPVERVVGTIGADALKDKILVLDFPEARYSLLTDSLELPAAIRDSVQYASATLRNERLYVEVVLGGDTIRDVLYDCGSSSSTLTLPLGDWQKATGLAGDEPAVKKDSIPAFGHSLGRLSAAAKGDMTFGLVKVKAPVIDHVSWDDPSLTNFKILGNAPFYDDYVVVADFKYVRLGVAKPDN
jgi:hypothetical protein